jgi:transcription initiation factor IIE alpha subunit
MIFNDTYKPIFIRKRNPLNKLEPKRETSLKKINKFDLPHTLIESEINIEQNEINRILLKHYNDNIISLLTGIKKKYGRDIYDKIRVFLSN